MNKLIIIFLVIVTGTAWAMHFPTNIGNINNGIGYYKKKTAAAGSPAGSVLLETGDVLLLETGDEVLLEGD